VGKGKGSSVIVTRNEATVCVQERTRERESDRAMEKELEWGANK